MRYHREDEFHFDPDLEFTDTPKEPGYANEYASIGAEDQIPPAYRAERRGAAVAVTTAGAEAEREKRRHEFLKKF